MDNEDSPLTYSLPTISDGDSGDTHVVTTSALSGWISFDNVLNKFTFSPSIPTVVTSYTITVTITDDNSCGDPGGVTTYSESFTLTVTGTNEVPTWDSAVTTALSVNYGETFTYYFPTYSDGDPSDTHTEIVTKTDLSIIPIFMT
jgi:hypothetical protein